MKVLAEMQVWCAHHAKGKVAGPRTCCPLIFRDYEWGSVPREGDGVELADGWAAHDVFRSFWCSDGTGSIRLDPMYDHENELEALLEIGWRRNL